MELRTLPHEGVLHCVGIGGSGMSALAHVLLDRGRTLHGSELHDGAALSGLRERGVRVTTGAHSASALAPKAVAVIASAAIPDSNPELVAARARGLPVLRYAEALGATMAERRGIAIAGTHGKSTTTGMVATVLSLAGRDPSFVIGAEVRGLGRPGRGGSGADFVVEACEYHRSFLALRYEIAAVVNVEAEHLDYFGDFDGVVAAFREFAARVPEGGSLVVGAEAAALFARDERAKRLVAGFEAAADVHPVGLRFDAGCGRFAIGGAFAAPEIALRVPGRHFVADALVAAGVSFAAGLDDESIARGLSEYRGAARRLELIRDDSVTAFTDYAHHPTELAAVAAALRANRPGRRLVAVFQPHQASRLRAFLPEFARTLRAFDRVLVADIYRVRDSAADFEAVHSRDLAAAIEAAGGSALACGSAADTIERLGAEWRANDVAILLGAGDIDDFRDEVATALPVPDRR
jgi:UDP-N-acetylmuramate--alanine ligase